MNRDRDIPRRMRPARWAGLMLCAALAGGCTQAAPAADRETLRQAAVAVLAELLETEPELTLDPMASDAARREALTARRQLQAKALEVVSEFPAAARAEWLTRALGSPSDGVRYAALLTIGRLADYQGGTLSRPFLGRVRELAADANDYVKVAAAFALYRITGQAQAVAGLPRFMALRDPDPARDEELAALRAQALFVLSLMPELEPRSLIRAMLTDRSAQVQVMAWTRLALLGEPRAIDQVINMAQSAYADDQEDALEALGRVALDDLLPLKRLLGGAHQAEVRMGAARALGRHGDRSGQELALKWLNYTNPERLRPADRRKDPFHEQRVRWLAALALGAIGDYERSSGPLLGVLQRSDSDRFRLYAARAALELLGR